MDTKLNHSELSTLLSQETSLSLAKAEQFTKNFFDIIIEGLEKDGIVKINGLGTFKVIDVASRNSVNVNTGEKFEIKGHRKITFIPSDALKEKVNMPFAMFEPVEVTDDYSDAEIEEEETEEVEEAIKATAEEQVELHLRPDNDVEVEELANESDGEENLPIEVIDEEEKAETPNDASTDEQTAKDSEVAEPIEETEIEPKEPLHQTPKEKTAENVQKSSATTTSNKKTSLSLVATLFIILVVAGAGLFLYFTSPEYFTDTEKTRDKKIIEKSLAAADSKLNVGNANEKAVTQVDNNSNTVATTNDSMPPYTNATEVQDATTALPGDKKNNKAPIVAAKDDPATNISTIADEDKANIASGPADAPFVLVPALSERPLASITLADTTIYKAVGYVAEHRVASNETLTKIALKYYKDKRLWPYVVHYNKMSNHNQLEIGMILKIPRLVAK